MIRHSDLRWEAIESKIISNDDILESLYNMEITGGEPDIVFYDIPNNHYSFVDCSIQSPIGRRALCYDREALSNRKKNKPTNNVIDMAKELGIEILSEMEYRSLQQIVSVDTKTSSWVKTPNKIRMLGGAIFCDNRYDTVFTYHNGADSYYSSRGFRGLLRI
jgi:hypothetical protein